jgi:hypothetical protein
MFAVTTRPFTTNTVRMQRTQGGVAHPQRQRRLLRRGQMRRDRVSPALCSLSRVRWLRGDRIIVSATRHPAGVAALSVHQAPGRIIECLRKPSAQRGLDPPAQRGRFTTFLLVWFSVGLFGCPLAVICPKSMYVYGSNIFTLFLRHAPRRPRRRRRFARGAPAGARGAAGLPALGRRSGGATLARSPRPSAVRAAPRRSLVGDSQVVHSSS